MSSNPKNVNSLFAWLVRPFHERPVIALLLLAIVLFSLLAVGVFIFTGGILPAALGFLSFLTPVMAPFLVSTALSSIVPMFIGLSLALVLGAYFLDALIDVLIPSKSKGGEPSTRPSVAVPTEAAVPKNSSNMIVKALEKEEKQNERVAGSSGDDAKPHDNVSAERLVVPTKPAVLQNPSAALTKGEESEARLDKKQAVEAVTSKSLMNELSADNSERHNAGQFVVASLPSSSEEKSDDDFEPVNVEDKNPTFDFNENPPAFSTDHHRYPPKKLMFIFGQIFIDAGYKEYHQVELNEPQAGEGKIVFYQNKDNKKIALLPPLLDKEASNLSDFPGMLFLKVVMEKAKTDYFVRERLDELMIPVAEVHLAKKHWVLLHIKRENGSFIANFYDSKSYYNPLTWMYSISHIETVARSALTSTSRPTFQANYVGHQGFMNDQDCGPFILEYARRLINGQEIQDPCEITAAIIQKHYQVEYQCARRDELTNYLFSESTDLSVIPGACLKHYNSKDYKAQVFLPEEAKGNVHAKGVFTKDVAEASREARDAWMQLTAMEVIQRAYAPLKEGSRDQFSIDLVSRFLGKIEAKRSQGGISVEEQDLYDADQILSAMTYIQNTRIDLKALEEEEENKQQDLTKLSESLLRTGVMQGAMLADAESLSVSTDLNVMRGACLNYYNRKNYKASVFLPEEAKGKVHAKGVFTKDVAEVSQEAREVWMKLTAMEVIQRAYAPLREGSGDQFFIDLVNRFLEKIEAKRSQGGISVEEQDLYDANQILAAMINIKKLRSDLEELKEKKEKKQQCLPTQCKKLAEALLRTGVMQDAMPLLRAFQYRLI